MKNLRCIINFLVALPFVLIQGFWYIPASNDFLIARRRQSIERINPSHKSEEEFVEDFCEANENWCKDKLYKKNEPFWFSKMFNWSSILNWIKAIWNQTIKNHHFISLSYIVIWMFVFTTAKYLVPIIIKNCLLFIFVFTLLLALNCIWIAKKHAKNVLLLWQICKLGAPNCLRIVNNKIKKILPWFEVQNFVKCLLRLAKSNAKKLLPLLEVCNLVIANSRKKSRNFILCSFLSMIINQMQLNRLFGFNVVSSKYRKKQKRSLISQSTTYHTSGSSSNDSSSASNDSDNTQTPSVAPEHKFRVVEKKYKTGAKKGVSHTTVSLIIPPYEFKRRCERDDYTYFSCNTCTSKHKFYNKATAKLVGKDTYELTSWPVTHACCPPAVQHKLVEFRRSLYDDIKRDPHQPLPKLYDAFREKIAKSIESEDDQDLFDALCPEFRSLSKGLYDHRAEFLPKNPKTFDEFDADHKSNKIEDESIIKGDFRTDDNSRVLLFSTDKCLEILSRAKGVAIDGTFKLAPLLWFQIVVIHAQVCGDTWVPVAFGFLPNKEYDTYYLLFDGLVKYMEKIKLPIGASYIMCDYEIGM